MISPSLPALLAELADAIGLPAALAIAHNRGGQMVYIPQPDHLPDSHWLVETVGMDAARTVAAHLGGGCHLIPLGPTGTRATIKTAITDSLQRGLSITQIVAETGVSRRTVERHRATLRQK
ncbi:hypothetical protein [Insolitispirillum peregrinum]|uniref:Homeodomain-like domain-containing protein n=1 Tax=Insolitispirillum peregrinum TaxID=80876 RepID=A0A1N7JLA1_9PROT|nr:hypothetical protein [Insolitispirillum peregrinum]SIS50119.1 hypothetical protein SAMN05421779_102367 [Insolitispirillum peregrinum]